MFDRMISSSARSLSLRFGLAAAAASLPALAPAMAHAELQPQQPAGLAAAGATAGSPTAPIDALYAALAQVERSQGSFAERARLLAPSIDNAFDLQAVLQNSVGLRYRTVPDAQKAELLNQFRQFTVARYVSNFAPGGADTFKVDPAPTPAAVPGEQIVHSHITAGGSTTDVNYVMRETANGWRVVDVLLNGNISQVAVQRADFGSSIESGDASALIESLKKKTATFQGG